MANIPASIVDDIIMAESVELLYGAAGADSTPDQLIAMRDIDYDYDHPETRTNHGGDRTYGHGPADIMLSFTLTASTDLLAFLRVRGTRVRNSLVTYPYAIKYTDDSGESKTVILNGKLKRRHVNKNDGDQEVPASVECMVRVTDEVEPVAT